MDSSAVKELFRKHKAFLTLLALILAVGSTGKISSIIFFNSGDPYERDFIQDYILAKALLTGLDISFDINTLGQIIFDKNVHLYPHRTPHPPSASFFFIPYTLLNYESALVAWRLTCCILLIACLLEIIKLAKRNTTSIELVLLFIFFLSSTGFIVEVELGQITLAKTYFELLALRYCTQNKNRLSGLFLGLAICIKLGGSTLLILLLIRKKFEILITAALVAITLFLLAELVFVGSPTYSYLVDVIPSNSEIYKEAIGNVSLVASFSKLVTLLSLIESWFNVLRPLPILALILLTYISFKKVLRENSFATAGFLCIGLSSILTPISWTNNFLTVHFFILFHLLSGARLNLYQILSIVILYRADVYFLLSGEIINNIDSRVLLLSIQLTLPFFLIMTYLLLSKYPLETRKGH